MKLSHVLVVAGGLLAATSAASFAADDAETLGQRLDNGSLSQNAFQQLIPFTGLTADQAKSMTLEEVVALRWQDS
jgi:hypothetical protein